VSRYLRICFVALLVSTNIKNYSVINEIIVWRKTYIQINGLTEIEKKQIEDAPRHAESTTKLNAGV